jgi:hypothetical protein
MDASGRTPFRHILSQKSKACLDLLLSIIPKDRIIASRSPSNVVNDETSELFGQSIYSNERILKEQLMDLDSMDKTGVS